MTLLYSYSQKKRFTESNVTISHHYGDILIYEDGIACLMSVSGCSILSVLKLNNRCHLHNCRIYAIPAVLFYMSYTGNALINEWKDNDLVHTAMNEKVLDNCLICYLPSEYDTMTWMYAYAILYMPNWI